jgi:hypothetical protein
MSKNAWLYLGTLAGYGALVALAILVISLLLNAGLIQRSGSAAVPPATTCVPTPAPPTDMPGPRTATPNPSQYGTVPPDGPSLTPIPIQRTIDLSPELQENDKVHWLVFHCDGTYEMFLTAATTQQAPLQPGDVLIYAYLPSIMGHYLVAPTFTLDTPAPPPTLDPRVFTEAALTATARSQQPYPPPSSVLATPTPLTPTPYPAPTSH